MFEDILKASKTFREELKKEIHDEVVNEVDEKYHYLSEQEKQDAVSTLKERKVSIFNFTDEHFEYLINNQTKIFPFIVDRFGYLPNDKIKDIVEEVLNDKLVKQAKEDFYAKKEKQEKEEREKIEKETREKIEREEREQIESAEKERKVKRENRIKNLFLIGFFAFMVVFTIWVFMWLHVQNKKNYMYDVSLGMTKEQVLKTSWDSPISKEVDKNTNVHTWEYENKEDANLRTLYFDENGILIGLMVSMWSKH